MIQYVLNKVVSREDEVKFKVTAHKTITILVENMGYIGFSKAMQHYDAGKFFPKDPSNVFKFYG